MNRYFGNTGRREFFPEPEPVPPPKENPPRQKISRGGGLPFDVSSLLRRLSPDRLEQEDLLLLLVLWLLYRESGDREMLIALGAFLLL